MEEDEEILNLSDNSKVSVSIFNPPLLAIKYKALDCLKYLVDVDTSSYFNGVR
jgi:hypothetical protein